MHRFLTEGKGNVFLFLLVITVITSGSGCKTSSNRGSANFQNYPVPEAEATWIRSGEPIEFEAEEWYPTDEIENIMDSEVYFLGEFRGVAVFVARADVRPYNRLYTKFDKNQFRCFLKKEAAPDDSN